MRFGDYVLAVTIALNITAAIAYAIEGHWRQVGYWLAVLQLNYWLMMMR